MNRLIATRPSDKLQFEKSADLDIEEVSERDIDALITRVNGCTRFEFENTCDGWMKTVYWLVIGLFLLIAVFVAIKGDGPTKVAELSPTEISERISKTYFINSSKLKVGQETDWSVQNPSNSESITTSENSGTESDEIGILV